MKQISGFHSFKSSGAKVHSNVSTTNSKEEKVRREGLYSIGEGQVISLPRK